MSFFVLANPLEENLVPLDRPFETGPRNGLEYGKWPQAKTGATALEPARCGIFQRKRPLLDRGPDSLAVE